jgi:hypothetical protein
VTIVLLKGENRLLQKTVQAGIKKKEEKSMERKPNIVSSAPTLSNVLCPQLPLGVLDSAPTFEVSALMACCKETVRSPIRPKGAPS